MRDIEQTGQLAERKPGPVSLGNDLAEPLPGAVMDADRSAHPFPQFGLVSWRQSAPHDLVALLRQYPRLYLVAPTAVKNIDSTHVQE